MNSNQFHKYKVFLRKNWYSDVLLFHYFYNKTVKRSISIKFKSTFITGKTSTNDVLNNLAIDNLLFEHTFSHFSLRIIECFSSQFVVPAFLSRLRITELKQNKGFRYFLFAMYRGRIVFSTWNEISIISIRTRNIHVYTYRSRHSRNLKDSSSSC